MNIPLGIWRAGARKFSVRWFAAIHIAVPMIYYIRITTGISPWIIPVLIAMAVAGQLVGGKIHKRYMQYIRYKVLGNY
ncbi:hypothetical protein [Desulfuribacillus stibiiarsenatis]|nr:hypothetical protein [Desulfuribacillus stibiiarsenatis]